VSAAAGPPTGEEGLDPAVRRAEKRAKKERKARRRARWRIEHRLGSPAFLHGLPLPDPLRRSVWVMGATSAAVALGSAQRSEAVDAARAQAAGFEVVRRHSGGGAVVLQPGAMRWIDVLVPAGDPFWQDDVGRSFLWLGQAWADALAAVGVAAEVHTGAPIRTEWSPLVCFSGLGTGEVTIGGRKVVGFSQRRTRAGARFQCLVLADWDPRPLLSVLDLDPAERARGAVELADVATGVGTDRLGPLVAALLTTIEGRRVPTTPR
jgi:lipoate-protein ligase A